MQEPIIAWRAWRVGIEVCDYKLQSLYDDSIWPFGQPMKEDQTKYANVPTDFCLPGIHAFKTMQNLADYLCEGIKYDHLRNVLVVLGEVYLWGKIKEHKLGYRAEYAYPKKIRAYKPYNPEKNKPDFHYTKFIANNYGCEIFIPEGVTNE